MRHRPPSRQPKQQENRMQCYHALPPNHYICRSKRTNPRNLKPTQRHTMPPRRLLAKPKNKAAKQLVMKRKYSTYRRVSRHAHYDLYMKLCPKHRPGTIHIVFPMVLAIPCIWGFHGQLPCQRNISILHRRFALTVRKSI